MLATRAGEFPVHLFDRPAPAEIGLVVEVDGQNSRVVPHVNPAVIGLIDLQSVGIDDVLPTMVFKIASHRALLPGLIKRILVPSQSVGNVVPIWSCGSRAQ